MLCEKTKQKQRKTNSQRKRTRKRVSRRKEQLRNLSKAGGDTYNQESLVVAEKKNKKKTISKIGSIFNCTNTRKKGFDS